MAVVARCRTSSATSTPTASLGTLHAATSQSIGMAILTDGIVDWLAAIGYAACTTVAKRCREHN